MPRAELLDSLKKKAKTDRATAQKLIADAVGTVSSQLAVKLPTMSQISRTISRSRNAEHFAVAKNADGLNLTSKYTNTQRGDNFLLYDNEIEEDRLLIFGTLDNLRVLRNCIEIFCDGTFDICPPSFGQVYTIHGNICNILCEIFGLMKNLFAQVNTEIGICHSYTFWQRTKNKQHMNTYLSSCLHWSPT